MEFQNQLEKILLENHHNYKIDFNSFLKGAISKLNAISIEAMYFGMGTFQKAELFLKQNKKLFKEGISKRDFLLFKKR